MCHQIQKKNPETLNDVGLSYIKLGQPSTELSGGEAQRIKLATELIEKEVQERLYTFLMSLPQDFILPMSTSLSIYFISSAEGGNTVVVIEHNLDVIKTADYIIDMGPEGGDRGGTVIAKGTPEEVAKVKKSYTGQYVKKYL